MRRVVVTGPAGAGKSRLARELGALLGIRVLHLDELYWRPGWVRTPEDEWKAAQRRELASDAWIVESQYDDILPDWLDAADTIVFVDASPIRCLWRVTRRRLDAQPGTGVPSGSDPAPAHRALWKFLANQWHYRRRVRRELIADLARRREPQRIVVVRRGADLQRFLTGL
jgi:adenylate kinase family enzyme